MAGVYGEFLGLFPELMETFHLVKQTPLIGGGYAITDDGETFSALLQTADVSLNAHDSYSRKAESSGTEQGIVSELKHYVLWTPTDISLSGYFVVIDGDYYAPAGKGLYNKEGGFYRLEVAKVVGRISSEETLSIIQGDF